MEMYSTDWAGCYPSTLGQLTPNYLKTIPDCQAVERMTYKLQIGPNTAYNTVGFEDYYFLECEGANHTAFWVPPNSHRHPCPSGGPESESLAKLAVFSPLRLKMQNRIKTGLSTAGW